MLFLLFALCLVFAFGQPTSSVARFSIHDADYAPKSWKLTPRTQTRPSARSTLDLKPDDYFKFIPSYVGSVLPGKDFTWNTSCFQQNTASLVINGNDTAILTIAANDKTSFFCDDSYLFGYVASFDVTYLEVPYFNHHIKWPGGWSEAELYDLKTKGIRIFKFPDGISYSSEELFETVLLFFGGLIGAHVPEWTAEDNLQFLKDHMDVEMPKRPIQKVNIDPSQVKSGDFLGIMRLDGLDPMLAWAMGAHTGHTAITIWMDGKLYVCESTINSAYWPTNGIQRTPWNQWLDQAEAASYNVIHLPLHPKVAAKFDVDAAIKWFKTVEGLPYGFHNQFTGWIDTPEDNFPGALSFQLAELIMPFGDWLLRKELQKGQTFDFLSQGLNKRLNTKGLSLIETYMEASKRGISLVDLILIPEQDDWVFDNDAGTPSGPSMVCDVFVTRIWKAAGIFGNMTDTFYAAEFTNWDAYTLNIFDGDYVRPPQCVKADPDSQFCQLLGEYRMSLPDYNKYAVFPHMRERCPTKPPKYIKPLNC